MLKLSDEALEKVSGGGVPYTQPAHCIYCKKTHILTKRSTQITYNREIYTCDQYWCDLFTRFFFLVTDARKGTQFYLTDRMEEKHI